MAPQQRNSPEIIEVMDSSSSDEDDDEVEVMEPLQPPSESSTSQQNHNHVESIVPWLLAQDGIDDDDEDEEEEEEEDEVELQEALERSIDRQEEGEILATIEAEIDAQEARRLCHRPTQETFPVRPLALAKHPNSRVQYCAEVCGGASQNAQKETNEDAHASSTWQAVALWAKKLRATPLPKATILPQHHYEIPNDDHNWAEVTEAVHKLARRTHTHADDPMVKVTKQVPTFLTAAIFEKDYAQPFRKRLLQRKPNHPPKPFRVQLQVSASGGHTLVAKGPKSIVEEFRAFFTAHSSQVFLQQSLQTLLADPQRYEFDVRMPHQTLLEEWTHKDDAALVEVHPSASDSKTILGLGVDWNQLQPTSPLYEFLESLFDASALQQPGWLVAIRRIDFVQPTNAREWHQERRTLQSMARKMDNDDVVVTLAVPSFVSLETINKDRLVGDIRRAGTPETPIDPHDEETEPLQETEPSQSIDKNSQPRRPQKRRPAPIKEEGAEEEVDSEMGPPAVIDVRARGGDNETVISGLDSHVGGEEESSSHAVDPKLHMKAQAKPARFDAYLVFTKKFKAIYDIEYKGTGINSRFVMGQMWKQHKQLLKKGETCEEDCPCASRIDELTQDIVLNHTLKMQKDHEKENRNHQPWKPPANLADPNESPVGFVNHFAPKYFPKVREQFPDEKPIQIFNRLVEMWKLHLKQRRFGIECKANCECGAGWKLVFREGDVFRKPDVVHKKKISTEQRTDALPRLPRKRPSERDDSSASLLPGLPRKRAAESSSSSSLLPGLSRKRPAAQRHDSASLPGLPRKRTALDESPASSLAAESAPIQKKSKPARAGSLLKNNSNTMASYCVSYNVGEPLGFYCATKWKNGKQVCCITSVCPTGQSRAKNEKIQKGTCVESVELMQGGKSVSKDSIEDYKELQQFYNHAKGSAGAELKLWFVNLMVQNSSGPVAMLNGALPVPASSTQNADWSSRGKWRGKQTDGWAGGAETVYLREPKTTNTQQAGLQQGKPQARGTAAAPAKSPPTTQLSWSQVTSTRPPSHRDSKQVFSILRAETNEEVISILKANKQKVPSSRKIQFGSSNDERFFDIETPSDIWLKYGPEKSGSSTGGYQLMPPSATRPSNIIDPREAEAEAVKAIVRAVRSDNIDAFLEQLNTGYIRTDSMIDGENWLDREYAFAKTQRPRMEEMYKVLSIHREAGSVIESSQNLRAWNRFVIRVEKIMDMTPNSERMLQQESNSFDGVVSYHVLGKTQKLHPLPRRHVPNSGVVDFGREDGTFPEYTIHYNSQIPEARSLTIELQTTTTDRTAFASVDIPIDWISKVCLKMDEPEMIEKDITVRGGLYFERGMKIRLSATKTTVERNYLSHKKEQGSAGVSTVLEWIGIFNAKNRTLSSNKLKAQICGRGNFSLLHAAVVFEKPELVRKLLSLGADPNERSTVGSAASYAMSMADRAREKLQHDLPFLESKGADAVKKRELSVKRLEEAHEILRHAHQSALGENGLDNETRVAASAPEPPQNIAGSSSTSNRLNVDHCEPSQLSSVKPAATGGSDIHKSTPASRATKAIAKESDFITAVFNIQHSKNSKDGWAFEKLVAHEFYQKVGRRDETEFMAARDMAFSNSLVEYGRQQLTTTGTPMVTCGEEASPGLSKGLFLRLTTAGGVSLANHFEPALESVEHTTQGQFHSQNSKAEPASMATETAPTPSESYDFVTAVFKSQHSKNVTDCWADESKVAIAFYQQIGRKDKNEFVCARGRAYSDGLVEFGRRKLTTNAPIVKCGAESSYPNLSMERFFRLTAAGLTLTPDHYEPSFADGLQRLESELSHKDNQPSSVKHNTAGGSNVQKSAAASRVAESTASPRSKRDHLVMAVSKLLQSRDGWALTDGWARESPVAIQYYKEVGRKDNTEFKFARDRAFSDSLVEYGRRQLATKDAPIVKCGGETSYPGLSHERFLRVSKAGFSLVSGATSTKSATRQSGKSNSAELESAELGKRKAVQSLDAQPSAKRPANPIIVQGLDQQQVVAAPTTSVATTPAPATGFKTVSDSTPVDVLGGVSKMVSAADHDDQPHAATPPQHRDRASDDSDFIQFLESAWNSLGDWTENKDVAIRFYKKLGTHSKQKMKAKRREANDRGFIKWGRRDLRVLGEPVVEVGVGQKEGLSLDSYLMLTDAGLQFLKSNGFRESTELGFRQNTSPSKFKPDTDLHDQSPPSRASDHGRNNDTSRAYGTHASRDHVSVATDRQHDVRPRPTPGHSRRDMEVFLDSVAQCGDRGGWSHMSDVIAEFYQRLGTDNEGLLIDILTEATRQKYLEWDDMRDRDLFVHDPRRIRSVSRALIRLTRAGRRTAERRNDSPPRDRSRSRERRPSDDRSRSYDRNSYRHERTASRSSSGGSVNEESSRHEYQGNGEYGRPSGVDRQNTEPSLPDVRDGRYWVSSKSELEICKQRDCNCSYPHVCPPLGRSITSKHSKVYAHLRQDEVSFHEENELFTAANYDERKRMFYLSEGGHLGRKSRQGVYWYPAKALAKRALQTVMAAANDLSRTGGRSPPPPPPPQHGREQWRGFR